MNSAHENIRIEFTLGGQPFEAVEFLREGEESCLGEEAIRRCDNGHIIRSDADWRLLYENRNQLPEELRRYWLATARPSPGRPRRVSFLHRVGTEWYDDWDSLGNQWHRSGLVLRRRV